MPCMKLDCAYRNLKDTSGFCNYMQITGNTKLGQLKRGEKYDVDTCQFYKKGRKQKAAIDPPFAKANDISIVKETQKIDSDKAFELYDLHLGDEDMAMFLDTIPTAVALWRQRRGLLRPPAVNEKVIEWVDISRMMNLGYTDGSLSEYFKLDIRIIKLYRQYLSEIDE